MTLLSYLAGLTMVPHKTPVLFQYLFPQYLWKKKTEEKVIYLTFDDGPIPEVTPWVLACLKRYRAKATFFCVGDNVRKYPDIFQMILSNGHTVGNHTYHHFNGKTTSDEKYLESVRQCDDEFNKHQVKSDLFRPPYGRIKASQRKALPDREIIMWSVLSKDYLKTLNPAKILKTSIEATEKGSIIVFHDNLKAYSNLYQVLPEYLEYFHQLGYRFHSL